MMRLDVERVAKKKREQAYDPDPPRCRTCIYYARGPARNRSYSNKGIRKEEEHCSFGNFKTQYFAVCDEWRSKAGETVARLDQPSK